MCVDDRRSKKKEEKNDKVNHLDGQLSLALLLQNFLKRLQRGLDILLQEPVHLLRGTSDESRRIHKRLQIGPDGLKVRILLNPLDQIVLSTLLLHNRTSLVREDTDVLMALLTITTLLDHGHDDVLGGHEGELLVDAALDDLGVDDEALGDVLEEGQEDVCGEEGLGQADTTVGTIEMMEFENWNKR